MRRWVLHVDMDAFFASVEQLTRPTLRGRAVLVGGTGPRGTVAGASYAAREYGARSAMPMGEARRRCPIAVVLPPRFRVYQAVSKRVLAIVRESSDLVEQVSIDEAFLEPTQLADRPSAEVDAFAARLRSRIEADVGVTASVGAGPGKQLAKIASGLAKPDGAFVIAPDEQDDLLASLPVRKLWGVGPVTGSKLARIGVHTIGELAQLRINDVTALLGQAHGTEMHRLARGIDDHPVAERAESKQVGAETTFDTDITDTAVLRSEVAGMAEAAHRRLIGSARAARTVTVKVRGADFTTISRAETFPSATSDLGALRAAAQRLIPAAVPPGTPVRLVGVSYSGLASFEQEPLFSNPSDPPAEHGPEKDDVAQQPESAPRPWRAGDDAHHDEHGHGWVQGAGHGRVTVRFETAASGPGPVRTFAADDPALQSGDPMNSFGG
ncbi:DNA polymerase IV [Saccharopolyspora sp. HNM0983]|uniref:DNA polymerase IV n=1 Tax=Saccharopolyspora montiporae TaxID=2781240 RepID=A0A929BCI2_9PSEU|nr:DNA polymerase IV [Saccharopolyspora sp. HNM0983]MBE9376260.1 DNA polymerase IV [Saccharopolyspora sp. HNM0983]